MRWFGMIQMVINYHGYNNCPMSKYSFVDIVYIHAYVYAYLYAYVWLVSLQGKFVCGGERDSYKHPFDISLLLINN